MASKTGPRSSKGNENKGTLVKHSQKGNDSTVAGTLPGPLLKDMSEMASGHGRSALQRVGGKGSTAQGSGLGRFGSGSSFGDGSMVYGGSWMRGGVGANGTLNPALLRLMSQQKSSDSECLFDDRVVRKRSEKANGKKGKLKEAKVSSEDLWREKIEETWEEGRWAKNGRVGGNGSFNRLSSECDGEGSGSQIVKSGKMRGDGKGRFGEKLGCESGSGARDE